MKKNEKAFTLIEIVLAILLIGIIAGFVGGILFHEIDFYKLIVPRKEVKIESKLVFERLVKEFKDAYKNSYNAGNNVKFKVTYNVFKGYTTVRIYTSGGNLYFVTDNATPSLISNNVTFFNITSVRWQPDRDLVRIRLSTNAQGATITQETTVFLRNER